MQRFTYLLLLIHQANYQPFHDAFDGVELGGGVLAEEVCHDGRLLVRMRWPLELLDETYRHHRLSFACATLDPEKGDAFTVLPSHILDALNNPFDRLVEQLVFFLKPNLDIERVRASQSMEASAVEVAGGERYIRRSAPVGSGETVARTCVQADVVDLGGPWLGHVPTNAGADGHPHTCTHMLDLSRDFVLDPPRRAQRALQRESALRTTS